MAHAPPRSVMGALSAYACVSFVLLGCATYHAAEHVSAPWSGRRILDICNFMVHEPLCTWTLINMSYCSLLLAGKLLQWLVFGDLSFSERQHVKDKAWHFVFYKFIFIFGILNIQSVEEMVLWGTWFTVLGYFQLLVELCWQRLDRVSSRPLACLLVVILGMSLSLLALSLHVAAGSLHTFAGMAAECALVAIKSAHLLLRYEARDGGKGRHSLGFHRELGLELAGLGVEFLHHLHMLVWANIFVSMASLVIALQLCQLYYEIRHRLRKFQNYRAVVRNIDLCYPLAVPEGNGQDCAICWEPMEVARRLPCGHIFHSGCLRSWLEQDASCPTCRLSLTPHIPTPKALGSHSSGRRHLVFPWRPSLKCSPPFPSQKKPPDPRLLLVEMGFSSSAQKREAQLLARKLRLLEMAKLRYLSRRHHLPSC